MFIKQLLLIILIVGIAVFLLNIKAVFKKNGRLEKSCSVEQRIMHKKGLNACASCGNSPLECELDEKEHYENVHKKIKY